MPKRARSEAPAPQIVVNYFNTVHNYFAAAPAAQPPPTEEGPKRLFPTNAERFKRARVVKHGKSCAVLSLRCPDHTGGLYGTNDAASARRAAEHQGAQHADDDAARQQAREQEVAQSGLSRPNMAGRGESFGAFSARKVKEALKERERVDEEANRSGRDDPRERSESLREAANRVLSPYDLRIISEYLREAANRAQPRERVAQPRERVWPRPIDDGIERVWPRPIDDGIERVWPRPIDDGIDESLAHPEHQILHKPAFQTTESKEGRDD